MSSDIEQAIRQICEEKGLSYEAVIETVESALSAAYRKDYGNRMQNIEAEFEPSTGDVRLFDVKTVVDDIAPEELEKMQEKQAEEAADRDAQEAARDFKPRKKEKEHADDTDKKTDDMDSDKAGDEDVEKEEVTFNPKTEVMFSDARVLKMDVKIDDIIRTELPLPGEFGRMAAMTAKQVITQKLREAEREIIFAEYKEQEGEVLIGTVQRQEGRVVLVDLGRSTGVIIPEDQVRGEQYNPGDRIKVLVREVSLGTRGPQILLSRSNEELVNILFDLEIPEIADGTVEIKAIAREAGARSKVAVHSTEDSIDPIGACIGQRGIRIQTIINELGGEKIDVIEWDEDPRIFITNALAPAKVIDVQLNEDGEDAIALVDEDQLSLAIGRGGQNVRLAAKLTGFKLSVRDSEEEESKVLDSSSDDKDDTDVKEDKEEVIDKSKEVSSADAEQEVASTDVEKEVVDEIKEVKEKEVKEEVKEEVKKDVDEEIEDRDEDIDEDEE